MVMGRISTISENGSGNDSPKRRSTIGNTSSIHHKAIRLVGRTFGSTGELAHLAMLHTWTLKFKNDPDLEEAFDQYWQVRKISKSGWYFARLFVPINLPFSLIYMLNTYVGYESWISITRLPMLFFLIFPWVSFNIVRKWQPDLLRTKFPTRIMMICLFAVFFLNVVLPDYAFLRQYGVPSLNPSLLIFNLMLIEVYTAYGLRPVPDLALLFTLIIVLRALIFATLYSSHMDYMLRDFGILMIANWTTGIAAYRQYVLVKLMFRDRYLAQKAVENSSQTKVQQTAASTSQIKGSNNNIKGSNGNTKESNACDPPSSVNDVAKTKNVKHGWFGARWWAQWTLLDENAEREDSIRRFIGRKTPTTYRQVVLVLFVSNLALYILMVIQSGSVFAQLDMIYFASIIPVLLLIGLGSSYYMTEKLHCDRVQDIATFSMILHSVAALGNAYLYYYTTSEYSGFHGRLGNVIIVMVTALCIVGYRFSSMLKFLIIVDIFIVAVVYAANRVSPIDMTSLSAWLLTIVLTSIILGGSARRAEKQARHFYASRNVQENENSNSNSKQQSLIKV